MRRVTLLLSLLIVPATLLSGCATNDRFSYAREDPLIWFLSGMPAPYDLNWGQTDVPQLPVLNPPDYTPPPPMQPLDYPRGWNPDYPPLMPLDAGNATNDAPATTGPQPEHCSVACDGSTAQVDAATDAARADPAGPPAGPVQQY